MDVRARFGSGDGKLQLRLGASNRLCELGSRSQCDEREKGMIEIRGEVSKLMGFFMRDLSFFWGIF